MVTGSIPSKVSAPLSINLLKTSQPRRVPLVDQYPDINDSRRALATMAMLGYTKERTKTIMYLAKTESMWRESVKNRSSSAGGFTQIMLSTFNNFKCKGDRFNLRDNIVCANLIINSSPSALYSNWERWW